MGQILERQVFVFAASSLSGSAQDFGVPLTFPAKKWAIINASTMDVEIDDGTGEDSIYMVAGATLAVGEGEANEGKAINIQSSFRIGTQFTITGVLGTPGTGTITLYLFGD